MKLISIAALVIATIAILNQTPRASAQHDSLPADGRFQIVINPNVRADTFLVDTATGKIWQRATFTDLQGSPDAWVAQPRLDNASELATWGERQSPKVPGR